MRKYDVGTIHKTNERYDIEIIENVSYRTRMIKFLDNFKYEKIVGIPDILSGKIKNPYHTSIHGFGIVGECETNHKAYHVWSAMIGRIHSNKKQSQYYNTNICEEWRYFYNFKIWFKDTFPNCLLDFNIELDKDLLQMDFENKTYSPDTCVWLPKRINLFLHTNYKSNTSGRSGVRFDIKRGKYIAQGSDFNSLKNKNLGRFDTIEEAEASYKKYRLEQVEKAKQYLRDLNYLPEKIIQLIK